MSNRNTIDQQIANAQEDIRQRENKLKQLQQQQKEQERKARTKRLCSRGGYVESRLPEIIALTDEQFKTFIEKTVLSEYARKILDGLAKQNAETVSGISAKTAAQTNKTANAETTQIKIGENEDKGENEDGGGKPTRA